MKKLPEIFQNDSLSTINNNKEYFYSAYQNSDGLRSSSVNEELNRIFGGVNHPFNETLLIKTENKDYETSLVYRSIDKVITIDNDTIHIDSIISITPKNSNHNTFH